MEEEDSAGRDRRDEGEQARHPYSFGPDELRRRGAQTREAPTTPRKDPTNAPKAREQPGNANKNDKKDQEQEQEEEVEGETIYECNICFDTASMPVVTFCGHLYCWPCIHQWMTGDRSAANTCPVCKSEVSRDRCIPIYAKGADRDPRNEETQMPNRPAGQRTEPHPTSSSSANANRNYQQPFLFNIFGISLFQQPQRQQFQNWQNNNFAVTAGFFGLPFLSFGFQTGANAAAGQNLTAEQERERRVAQFFLLIGLMLITYIILL